MCCGCWKQDGSPQLDTPAVRAIVARLLVADSFGALHIVVDDNNLDDDDLDWCRNHGLIENRWTAADQALYSVMRVASKEERTSAMGVHDGCWSFSGHDRKPSEVE